MIHKYGSGVLQAAWYFITTKVDLIQSCGSPALCVLLYLIAADICNRSLFPINNNVCTVRLCFGMK